MNFDPILNLTSGLGIILDIIFTSIEAISLPFVTVVLYPLQTIFQYLTSGTTVTTI